MQHLTFVIASDNVLLLYCFDHCRCIVVILFWLLLMSYCYTVLVAIDVALLLRCFLQSTSPANWAVLVCHSAATLTIVPLNCSVAVLLKLMTQLTKCITPGKMGSYTCPR